MGTMDAILRWQPPSGRFAPIPVCLNEEEEEGMGWKLVAAERRPC